MNYDATRGYDAGWPYNDPQRGFQARARIITGPLKTIDIRVRIAASGQKDLLVKARLSKIQTQTLDVLGRIIQPTSRAVQTQARIVRNPNPKLTAQARILEASSILLLPISYEVSTTDSRILRLLYYINSNNSSPRQKGMQAQARIVKRFDGGALTCYYTVNGETLSETIESEQTLMQNMSFQRIVTVGVRIVV